MGVIFFMLTTECLISFSVSTLEALCYNMNSVSFLFCLFKIFKVKHSLHSRKIINSMTYFPSSSIRNLFYIYPNPPCPIYFYKAWDRQDDIEDVWEECF